MVIEYSLHFWEQFELRRKVSPEELTVDMIESVIKNPDFIIEDRKPEREGRVKKINGRCLKVVIEKKNDKFLVITVFWDRTLRRRGLCR